MKSSWLRGEQGFDPGRSLRPAGVPPTFGQLWVSSLSWLCFSFLSCKPGAPKSWGDGGMKPGLQAWNAGVRELSGAETVAMRAPDSPVRVWRQVPSITQARTEAQNPLLQLSTVQLISLSNCRGSLAHSTGLGPANCRQTDCPQGCGQ